MRCYLFVHFREKTSPEGEQVYFALSQDGFHWQALNGGQPVLWAYYGDRGVRDMTIVRSRFTGECHIFATDLSLSYGMREKYGHSWENIVNNGSKCLAHWKSQDLIHWTEEELLPLGDESFGCLWAPDVIFDPENEDYVLHWSSKRKNAKDGRMAIYYARTKDFAHYTKPELLYQRAESGVIDSAMYEEKGKYYLFVKADRNPSRVIELCGDHVTGPFFPVPAFDRAMEELQEGLYEAPTSVQLEDGRWCLFVDFYGARGAGQGYVPLIAPSLASGDFVLAREAFSFPYGFKHGTILPITPEEYQRMLSHDWEDVPDLR